MPILGESLNVSWSNLLFTLLVLLTTLLASFVVTDCQEDRGHIVVHKYWNFWEG